MTNWEWLKEQAIQEVAFIIEQLKKKSYVQIFNWLTDTHYEKKGKK